MDQMQSSCLNMLQTVTAQKADSGKTKAEPSGEDSFRDLMKQAAETEPKPKAEQNAPTVEPSETEKPVVVLRPESEAPIEVRCPTAKDEELLTPRMEEFPGTMLVDLPVPRVVLTPEEEEILRMQEVAAAQILAAGQRITVEMPVEAPVEVVRTVKPAAVEVQNLPAAQQTEQLAEVIPESVSELTQTTEGNADLFRQNMDMASDGHPAEVQVQEQPKADTAEVAVEVEAPVFGVVEEAPIKVSETAVPAEQIEAEPVETQVADKLIKTLSSGETKVELQLTPENLGKVTIELIGKEDGSLHVVLHAERSQTRSLLEQDLSGLQNLLSRTTQQEVEVQVTQPHQQQQQQSYDGHQQQHQQQHQEQRDDQRSSADFLNQLRLGLLTPEADAS